MSISFSNSKHSLCLAALAACLTTAGCTKPAQVSATVPPPPVSANSSSLSTFATDQDHNSGRKQAALDRAEEQTMMQAMQQHAAKSAK